MKKLLFIGIVCILVCFVCLTSFAEGKIEAKGIYVDVFVEENEGFKAENITFSLYSLEGEKVAEQSFFLSADNKEYELYFDLDFVCGDKFILELTKGGKHFKAYDDVIPVYHNTMIETYAMLDESGKVSVGNRFSVSLKSNDDIPMDIYIKGRITDDKYDIKSVNGVAFCEMHRLLDYLYLPKKSLLVEGDNVTIKNEEKSVTVTVGKNTVVYDDGQTEQIGANVWYANGKTYLPVSNFAKIFAAEYKEIKSDFAYDMDIYPKGIKTAEEFVMKNGIDSKTEYLIWISKKDFKLHLFSGGKGNWHLVESFPCTIGANNTPTITGQFDYIEKIPKWYYPKYYVGPVMRFYNGYAIHTVLLNSDGTEYDGRVGMKLSLGCIRVKKNVMEYLIQTVPMKTKIYITE